jgi:hypothetical protein
MAPPPMGMLPFLGGCRRQESGLGWAETESHIVGVRRILRKTVEGSQHGTRHVAAPCRHSLYRPP